MTVLYAGFPTCELYAPSLCIRWPDNIVESRMLALQCSRPLITGNQWSVHAGKSVLYLRSRLQEQLHFPHQQDLSYSFSVGL